jgi:hypothetical protein
MSFSKTWNENKLEMHLKGTLSRHPSNLSFYPLLSHAALVDRMCLWWCRSDKKEKLALASMPVASIIDAGEWSNTGSGPLTTARTSYRTHWWGEYVDSAPDWKVIEKKETRALAGKERPSLKKEQIMVQTEPSPVARSENTESYFGMQWCSSPKLGSWLPTSSATGEGCHYVPCYLSMGGNTLATEPLSSWQPMIYS